jgi:hypothetical protein
MGSYHDNECNFTSTQSILAFARKEEQSSVRVQVIDKLKMMSDMFSPYSFEDRELFLDECEKIMKILDHEEVAVFVLPILTVYVIPKLNSTGR